MKRVFWLALLAAAVWSDLTVDTDSRIIKVSNFKRLFDAAAGRARTAQIPTPATPNYNGQASSRR